MKRQPQPQECKAAVNSAEETIAEGAAAAAAQECEGAGEETAATLIGRSSSAGVRGSR